jgi:hypothetical protein
MRDSASRDQLNAKDVGKGAVVEILRRLRHYVGNADGANVLLPLLVLTERR